MYNIQYCQVVGCRWNLSNKEMLVFNKVIYKILYLSQKHYVNFLLVPVSSHIGGHERKEGH